MPSFKLCKLKLGIASWCHLGAFWVLFGVFFVHQSHVLAATTINLNQVDIKVLIKTVSDVTGKNFLFDPNIRGQVTIVSATPVGSDALYQTFLSALGVLGYVAIPDGNIVKIVAEDKARFEGSQSSGLSTASVTTKVFSLQRASAPTVANLLKAFSPQWAQVAPGPNNTVIVSDRAGNVDRFERLIAQLDGSTDLDSEAVPLKSLSAAEAVRMVTQYLQQARTPDSPPGTASVMADERSNTLVVLGTSGERERLLKLLRQLDQPVKAERSNTQIVFLKNAQADQILPALEAILQKYKMAAGGVPVPGAQSQPQPVVVANKPLNALVISATSDIAKELRSAIEQLDVRRAQVVVEVLIAEISRERSQELGVNWAVIDQNRIAAANVVSPSVLSALQSAVTTGSAAAAAGAVGLGLSIAGGRVNQNGTSLGVLLNALRGDGTTNILSSPSIVTLDNEEANVTVGQEVPFVTGSYANANGGNAPGAINPFQTIERKDVGLKLSVTPQINTGSTVLLKLKLEVSSLAAGATGAADLITNKRSLADTVMVEDGQVLVLGGLVDDSSTESTRGIPGLSAIPILGALFRSQASGGTKRNLMVFLAPHILRGSEQADYYTRRKYEQLERQLPLQAEFLKNSFGQLLVLPPAVPSLEASPSDLSEQKLIDENLRALEQMPPDVEPSAPFENE